jgi:hypothetical protein
MARKVEYPPLLDGGFHSLDIEQLRGICVDAFPLSKTREKLMDSLEMAVEKIEHADFQSELWIDGSFLTKKVDPSDVDMALIVPARVRISSSAAVRNTLQWIESDETNDRLLIDGYVLTQHPETSPMFSLWDDQQKKFTKLFGTQYDDKTPKGVAIMRFRGGVQ